MVPNHFQHSTMLPKPELPTVMAWPFTLVTNGAEQQVKQCECEARFGCQHLPVQQLRPVA